MSISRALEGITLSLIFGISDVLADCNGCSNNPSSCVELVDDAVYGCYGTFTAPISASNLCESGYHMCESANEADLLGLTTSDCQNKVPQGHHFWSLESSVDYVTPEGLCYSQNGPVTYNDRPRDDLWGCASSQTDISLCGSIHNTPCGPFNKACTAPSSGAPWEEDGLWMCPCEGIELFTAQVTDASVGGVVCCRNTIPTDLGSGCDETITVWRINPGFVLPTPNFAPYVGKYLYYGNTNAGYPRYVHQDSGSEITLSLLNNNLVLTLDTDYDILYSTATTIADGVATSLGNNLYGIVDTFFSPAGTDMSASETNTDQIPLYNPDVATDTVNFLENFQMVATFSDCANYGLEIISDGTTTTPAPVPTTAGNGCPNYDDTVYSDCNGDTNCVDCQGWGCAQCANGYYKMGNLERCQSCTQNYPNCAQCGDWDGCTSCNSGYSLQYSQICNDEICE